MPSTLIKIVEVLILAPFIKQIVKMTGWVVRGKEETEEEGFHLQYIGEKSVYSPTTAVFDAIREMERTGHMAISNLERAMNALVTLDEQEIEQVYQVERQIDYLNHEITELSCKGKWYYSSGR